MPTDGVPTRRELIAAYWAGRVLTADGLSSEALTASYRILPIAGRVDLTELRNAEGLLERTHLTARYGPISKPSATLIAICELDEDSAVELILAAALENEPPLWMTAATGGDQLRDELVPEGAETALGEMFGDLARREAFLLARARKVEAEVRSRIGALGEDAVVQASRGELRALGEDALAEQVRRVSLISDELGYDVVAPRVTGGMRRLEVKTTSVKTSSVTIYLSRTEAMVGLVDRDWSLVICDVSGEAPATVVGWVSGSALEGLLPTNAHRDGSWESARLRLPVDALVPGLPSAQESV